MRIDIISVAPKLLESPFSDSILKRAQENGIAKVCVHNLRDYATNKHKNVDDYQYGGGAGMVMSIEPIATIIDKLKGEIKWGGRPPRDNSSNDDELMIYYDKQKALKYVRFV